VLFHNSIRLDLCPRLFVKYNFDPMLKTIITQFNIPGSFVRANRFGSGLINDTYLCEFVDNGAARKYIVQRINDAVFKQPEQVMQNVEVVTNHVISALRKRGVIDPGAVTPALVQTRDGRSFLRGANGTYWRMFHFIETGAVYDTVRDANHAFEVGRAVGGFQALVSDLSPDRLYDTLPGFHSTPNYLREYDDACQAASAGLRASAAAEQEFVEQRRSLAGLLIENRSSGKIPLRVVHNDPKVNNVMVDAATGKALCMLDLDTVKPGIVHFDFGDCIRSAANRAGEDAKDLSLVAIDRSLFEAVTRGYLAEAGGVLTKLEIELLPASVKVITFELGLRFLADHLRGDTYFKIRYPGHNLHRSRVQFRLLESIEAAEDAMTAFVLQHAAYRKR